METNNITELYGLSLERTGDRAIVQLTRPQVHNAIDSDLVRSLHGVCELLEADPVPLIITGGTSAFVAGADIGQLRDRRTDDALAGINSALMVRIAKLPMPTIAAIGGPALGGGAELAYACDFRIATPHATFGNPESRLGILAAAGATWRLRELVGEVMAKEMLLAGRVLNADEARAARLANEIVDPTELLATAHHWVDRISKAAPWATRITKLALRMPADAHPTFDNVAQAMLFESDEKFARMDKFLTRKNAQPQ